MTAAEVARVRTAFNRLRTYAVSRALPPPKLLAQVEEAFAILAREAEAVAPPAVEKAVSPAQPTRKPTARCGACRLWMLNECPKETTGRNGRKAGPSMNSYACAKFAER